MNRRAPLLLILPLLALGVACASPAKTVKQDALAREAPIPEVTTTLAVETPAVEAPVVTTAPKPVTTTTVKVVPVKRSGVTKAQYDQLTTDMTYAQAARILGSGGEELSSSEVGAGTDFHTVTVMYQWTGAADYSNMNAMFQNDKLVNKAQFGLE